MEEGEKCGEDRSIGEEEHIGRIARIFVLKSLSPMKFGTWTFLTQKVVCLSCLERSCRITMEVFHKSIDE